MKLDSYVDDVLSRGAHPSSFPASLELPAQMAGDFYRLWQEGERRAIEVGYNVDLVNGAMIIDTGTKFDGGPYFVDIKYKAQNSHCADVHSHPANSIGHVNGYAAHSMMDIRVLTKAEYIAKPLFIRFVVSSYYTYAIVYRQGHSAADERVLNTMATRLQDDQDNFFMAKNKLDAQSYFDKQNSCSSEKQFESWILQTKKATPGLGPEVQRLSMVYCTSVAHNMNLGFYAGHRGLGGWIYGSEQKLDLQ